MRDLIELSLRFHPSIESISETRKFVAALYQDVSRDPDATSRVGMCVHELLENTLKYSVEGEATLRIHVGRSGNRLVVTVETRNAVTAERRAGLEEFFAAIASAPDAFAFYQAAMAHSRTRRFGSGLGLARIWAEGEMPVSLRIEGNVVVVTAAANIVEPSKEDA